MKLLYTICVPNITYSCEVAVYNSREMDGLHVLVNNAVRKIFSFNRWESIKYLRESLGYKSITEIFAKRKIVFEKQLPHIGNSSALFHSFITNCCDFIIVLVITLRRMEIRTLFFLLFLGFTFFDF